MLQDHRKDQLSHYTFHSMPYLNFSNQVTQYNSINEWNYILGTPPSFLKAAFYFICAWLLLPGMQGEIF